MAAATTFGTQMALLTANLGGAVESLPPDVFSRGKDFSFAESITFASQVNGTSIAVARIPLQCVFLGLTLLTDTSTGSATMAFGNANNSTLYANAAALTATNTLTGVAKIGTYGKQVLSGYDSVTGNATSYTSSSGFGSNYDDVILTIGGANFPSSGNLIVVTKFVFP